MNPQLKIKDLDVYYGQQQILNNINMEFKSGNFYSIIGPNGSGKSTLIKALAKVIPVKSNKIIINNEDIKNTSIKQLSKALSYIPQNNLIEYDFTAYEVVIMGRNPYKKRLEEYNYKDKQIVEKYMKLTDTWKLRNKLITKLSGGEVQRVIAARTLTQEAGIILLDEPTSNLDLQYQIDFLKIFKEIKEDKIVIVVLHDLNLASLFSDKIILVNNGSIYASGNPWDVITKDNIRKIYNIETEITGHPKQKCPYVIPLI